MPLPKTKFEEGVYKLYEKLTYLDIYGGDVLITALLLLSFFILISYFWVMGKIKPIKMEWSSMRCHPAVIPFVSIINKPNNISSFKFTSENFTYCVSGVLNKIIHYFTLPVYYSTQTVTAFFMVLAKIINMLRVLIDWLRMKVMKIFEMIFSRMLNAFIPIQIIFIKLKAALGKTAGVMVTSLFTVLGSYYTLKSILGALHQLIVQLLIRTAVYLLLMWLLLPGLAIPGTILWLVVAVPTTILAIWLDIVLKIQTSKPGPTPGCFDENTIIKTTKGNKKIKNLKLNDVLLDGSKVNTLFKVSQCKNKMFSMNGIIVSGCHRVYQESVGWVYVRDHPDSRLLPDYRKEFIYCFNTSNKKIILGDFTFSDWDEIEEVDLESLKKDGILKINSEMKDLHKYLNGGFSGNTIIELEDGSSIEIEKLQVNDILRMEERVLAIVKISTEGLKEPKKYKLGNNYYIMGPNIIFKNEENINISSRQLKGEYCIVPKTLYHLITDKKHFLLNGIKFYDYNSCIEAYLDDTEAKHVFY